ncbi:MAG: DUF4157 domain-containing protein [Alphaproteobacteria bacterium]|nr:DUF4157 domain-containing protein [Alphaproteobacteria bacterium]
MARSVGHTCTTCGAATAAAGQCSQCAKQAAHGGRHATAAPALSVASSDHGSEHAADHMADHVVGRNGRHGGPMIGPRALPDILPRTTTEPRGEADAPPVVHEALTASGQALDPATRHSMETETGHRFSDVRIHTDATAARSARAIDALAYTAGKDIVFGTGQYRPQAPDGKWLLAHELGHVAQQRGAPAVVARKKRTAAGPEPKYDDETLDDYLSVLLEADEIEGDLDSDNKARALIRKGLHKEWPPSLWVLLIKEMLAGAVLNADERAILELLETASADDREKIAESVGYSELHKKIHGKERDRLYALFPVLNSLHPRGEKESVAYTFEEYIVKWESEQGRSITAEEKDVLARGCVGVTTLNLGQLENPNLRTCYGSFADALKSQRQMNDFLEDAYPNRRAIIFSKRFWSSGADFEPDPATGEIDMSGYDFSPRPGGFTNFDYGFYDESTGKWWHANHCDETTLGIECTGDTTDLGDMEVYESNLKHYSQRLGDFDKQVFCVAISRLASP